MLQYPIDPDYCLLLSALNQTGSLREAARLLGTDAPTLVRKTQRLASEHGFVVKIGNKWTLTQMGQKIALWTDGVINEQLRLKEAQPTIRVGSFAWLAEQMLIPEFTSLNESTRASNDWSFCFSSGTLEKDLLQGKLDFVITGFPPSDPSIAHRKTIAVPWVAIAPPAWAKKLANRKGPALAEALMELPHIKHNEIQPGRFLPFEPRRFFDFSVDGVIGLRASVGAGFGWTILPAFAVKTFLEKKELLKVDVEVKIKDEFSVWWMRDRKDLLALSKALVSWVSNFS